jgi:L-alanine-DL-glutamate epimerase-like enolase superfamily enzyme
MRIDKAEVIVTSPDRNFVTLKLTTDDGLTGLGDATLNGRELAVVSYLADHVDATRTRSRTRGSSSTAVRTGAAVR